jgi:hypothetical protein
MVLRARDGGRVTPSMLARLRSLARDRTIEILEERNIVATRRNGGRWTTTTTQGDALDCDEIWLATGSEATVEAEPILAHLQERHPTELVDGSRCWTHGCGGRRRRSTSRAHSRRWRSGLQPAISGVRAKRRCG